MDSTPQQPDLLSFSIGSWDGGRFAVELVNGELLFWNRPLEILRQPGDAIHCAADKDRWASFWEAVNRIGIWDWKSKYEPEGYLVLDGTQWYLELRHGERALIVEGDNAYPGGVESDYSNDSAFGQFLAALVQLTGAKELNSQW